MNLARKRLRLTQSPSHPLTTTSTPLLPSHDALHLLSSATPAKVRDDDDVGAVEEEEEEEGYLLVEEDNTDSSLVITMEDSRLKVKAARRRTVRRRRAGVQTEEEKDQMEGASESDEKEEAGVEMEIDRQLDQSLETKSKQHNLTTVNVRNIIHEVITNEHVVAMMKAAINETEAVPAFEPKMTRSKFKEVVEKGVVIPTWNISPIKKPCDVNKAPQFVDIPLAEEDSSDEEYHPDEEDEDETAEDTFQESDMESTASSPRGSRLSRGEEDSCSPWQASRRRLRNLRGRSVSMGPPPPPKAPPPKAVNDSTFLEKLHAVEEELAVCMEPYQPLSESEDEVGLMAYRTRSKRPLRDVPLGQLEAELQAPDITPDMYDSSSAHEDRDWTDWLRGLMTSDMDNEEECDDDDDPEYNFLADIDEPDVEDYRDDKAVRITKKEVNELMEELFETLKEDLTAQEVDEEGHEEEEEPGEEPQEEMQTFQAHTPLEQRNTELCGGENGPITGLRTVKEQLAWVRRKSQTHAPCNVHTHCPEPHRLIVDGEQRVRLQQQLQQHVQLLTQIHLLSSPVSKLQSEAETTRQFLVELDVLAQRAEAQRAELLMSPAHPGFCSIFRSSNLQGALQLLEELRQNPISYQSKHHLPDARGYMRCYPVMPAELAWLFATRPVFLYPELLPCASLDPALYCSRRTAAFTAAEDCLLVLGLRNMEDSCDPTKMVSQFLLRKTLVQVRRRILQCCRPGVADNIVKVFRYQRVLWPMPMACAPIELGERRPPVEREESVMPVWLVRSLPVIYPKIKQYNTSSGSAAEALPTCRWSRSRPSHLTFLRSASNDYSFTPGTRYPPHLPKDLHFRRLGFVQLQPLLPPSTDSSPLPNEPVYSPSLPPSPHKPCYPLAARSPQIFLHQYVLTKTDSPTDVITTSAVVTETIEQIKNHYQTFAGLMRRSRTQKHNRNTDVEARTHPLSEGPTHTQAWVEEDNEVLRMKEEEKREEEESEVLLAASESTSSAAGSVINDTDQEKPSSEGSEEETADEDGQREMEDEVFAQDYLGRVCELVKGSPDLSQQLLEVLDQFSAAGPLEASGSPELLYKRLSCVLQSWPQLLRDFAAFLNRAQARRCGLSLEQQLFERSRRFLRQLKQSLGESSSLYQQVVSVLQGSPTPPATDMDKISSLLRDHPDLQEIFQQFHVHLLPREACSETTTVFQNPPFGNSTRITCQQSEESETGSDGEEEERTVCARNISVTSTGEKVVIWTREADRTILKACQRSGATWKTFRQVSDYLGNKTAQQVRLRFQDLMSLFQSASQRSTSSEGQLISRQEGVPD